MAEKPNVFYCIKELKAHEIIDLIVELEETAPVETNAYPVPGGMSSSGSYY